MPHGPVIPFSRTRSHVDGLVWIEGVLHVRVTTRRLDQTGDEVTVPRDDAPRDVDPPQALSAREQGSGTLRELPTRSSLELVPVPGDGDRVAVRVRAEARFDPRAVALDAGTTTWAVRVGTDHLDDAHAVEVAEGSPARAAILGKGGHLAHRGEDGTLRVVCDAPPDALVRAARPRTAAAVVDTVPDGDGRETVRLTVPLDGIRVAPIGRQRVVARGAAELVAPAGRVTRRRLLPAIRPAGPAARGTFRLAVDGEQVALELTVPAAPGRWQVVLAPRRASGPVPLFVHVRRRRPTTVSSAAPAAHASADAAPRVSVIVPVHNGADTVEEAIRSVFAQTLPREQIEIITVDDGSSDDSLAILQRLAKQHPRMRVLTQPASGSAAAPRNAGIEVATGRHLFFLDADDLLVPHALEKLTEAADELDADVVIGALKGFADRGGRPSPVYRFSTVDADVVTNRLFTALGPTKLFRATHVKRLGLRFPSGLRHGEDQAFVAEAELAARRIVILADTVYYWVRGHAPVPGPPTGRIIEIRLHKTRLLAGLVERYTEPGERRDALLARPFGDRSLEGTFRRPFLALDPSERADLVDRVADEFGHLWTPGLRTHVEHRARPMYDLVFRRDAANLAALVEHAGGNVRRLHVGPSDDGFVVDAPASVGSALGVDALRGDPPEMVDHLTALTVSGGRITARGRTQPLKAAPLPDGLHAEWRRATPGPAGAGRVEAVEVRGTVRGTTTVSAQEAMSFSVDTEVSALPDSGLWDLWITPVWNGHPGTPTRFGASRGGSVDPDAVVLDGSRSVLHTNPRTGGLSIDRDGAHHEIPEVRVTALRTDADGRPEAVLHVPSLTAATRVYAHVDAEESRDARHRLPWSRVDDDHLAVRLPVPFTATTHPVTLAVSSGGVLAPVDVDTVAPVSTPELRVEVDSAGPGAARLLVTRTSPAGLADGVDLGPLPVGDGGTEPIRLWWWRWRHPTELNFGDEVTAPLIERLTGRRVVWTPLERAEIVGAGSVLQLALRKRGEDMPAVWGAGMIRPFKGEAPAGFVPRAVRGRMSLTNLSPAAQAGAALGDPGILADLLVDGSVTKRYALGVIPHYKDADDPTMRAIADLPGVRRIDVAWTPEEVAREIAACEVVVSSSMHGLIFADALGVPNARLKVSDKLVGGDHKFRDYCSAFGPDRYQPPLVPDDVRGLGLDRLVDLVRSRFRPPTGIDGLRRGLVEALPR